jgi:DNA recombination protein RmuC
MNEVLVTLAIVLIASLVVWALRGPWPGAQELLMLRGQIDGSAGMIIESTRSEANRARELMQIHAETIRAEIGQGLQVSADAGANAVRSITDLQRQQQSDLAPYLAAISQKLEDSSRSLRSEVNNSLGIAADSLVRQIAESFVVQKTQLELVAGNLASLTSANSTELARVRDIIHQQLAELQADNAKQLDRMRQTVEEKLQGALDSRLAASFASVNERLESVYRGLGEMQTLAASVGDLKKVLTNVSSRGVWSEVQLGFLLEQILAPEQFERNVKVKAGSDERVEFALCLPGSSDDLPQIWLPIDAKFPQSDYLRLMDAISSGDREEIERTGRELEQAVRLAAKSIRDKYIAPPSTTDFAILFLPTEGLFAEVLRRPGLAEELQRDCRVIVTGPTTLAALLNSLQIGFRTLAVQKRSSEVWELLGAVRTEFGNYSTLLLKIQRKLREASNTVDTAASRTRVIESRLRQVEEVAPVEETRPLASLIETTSGAEVTE